MPQRSRIHKMEQECYNKIVKVHSTIEEAVKNNPLLIKLIPQSYRTPELEKYALSRTVCLVGFFEEKIRTQRDYAEVVMKNHLGLFCIYYPEWHNDTAFIQYIKENVRLESMLLTTMATNELRNNLFPKIKIEASK